MRKRNFTVLRIRVHLHNTFREFISSFVPKRPAWQTVRGKFNPPKIDTPYLPYLLAAFAMLCLMLQSARAEIIEFTETELQAAYTLVRPETTSVRLDGQKAYFVPAPALRYFGVEAQEFKIDMNAIADLVDFRFDDVTAGMPELRFQNSTLEIEIPFADRVKGIRSNLGSMSLKGVSLTAVLQFVETAGGARELRLKATRFKGALNGTGLLSLAEGRVKKTLDEVSRGCRDEKSSSSGHTGKYPPRAIAVGTIDAR